MRAVKFSDLLFSIVSAVLTSLLITGSGFGNTPDSESEKGSLGGPSQLLALGPWAVDPEGQRGRIHTVDRGDTLWDISAAYLGTPWVWPSVWKDNQDIENPHLIRPNDHIWITAGEMRRITSGEAQEMIAAEEELAASLESLSDPTDEVAEPFVEKPGSDQAVDRKVQVVERAAMGFVSPDSVRGSTSIVDSPSERLWLAEGDDVYLGVGECEVFIGDEFTIFRDPEPVYDVGRGGKLGYHVEILGWARIKQASGASAIAEIIESRSALKRGDQLIPRERVATEVDVTYTPSATEGAVVFAPEDRTQMGDGDHVYLNRGSIHGFKAGSEVEVYLPGSRRTDRVSGRKVQTPDHIVAQLVLVEVQANTSVAYITETSRSLEVGDLVRPKGHVLAQR